MRWRIALVLLLIIQSISSAQAIRNAGVKVGGALASQSWEYAAHFTDLDTEPRWGVDIGVFVEWLNIPVFSLSSEMHYIQKGMSISVLIRTTENPEGTGEFASQSPRLDYLSLPLLGKVRFLDHPISAYVVVGPRVDFLLHTKGDGFEVVLDKFEKVDLGGTVGVGIDIDSFEFARVGIEIRFSPSFTDGYASDFLRVRNSSTEFLLVVAM